jgi:DNA helicase HerA-like ATPase
LEQIETIIKLIRSKSVGVYFCTQSPTDIPASVLGQLGLKIQHALRAFTAKDRKDIRMSAENYPLSAKIEQAADSDSADRQSGKADPSTLQKVASTPVARQIGRTLARELTRGLLGVLGVSPKRRRSRRSGLF